MGKQQLVWFVTGASRGFGLEIVRQALARGDAVVATARDPRKLAESADGASASLLPIALDVNDEGHARAAVEQAVARFGRIDVLVNNAGRGLLGAVEEASDHEARGVFDTNVFGLLTVTRAVLPVMRRQRSGRILNLSSVGGFAASPGWGVYCATKFAVEGLSEALHTELAPLGISVTIVEPGAFRTDFLDGSSLQRSGKSIEDYAATAGQMRSWADGTNHEQLGDPVKAAAAMIAVGAGPNPPLRLQLGADCVARVESKLAAVARELEQCRAIAMSTAHAGASTAGSAGLPM
jgi:NAD(P)-dependent dehydrogenase (short-subunit alcohol dehydrogenase family)